MPGFGACKGSFDATGFLPVLLGHLFIDLRHLF
jgi:hypothetical protein